VGEQRGYTLLAAAIIYLWKLGFFLDNEMSASQLKSMWAYMISTDPDNGDFDWSTLDDSADGGGNTDIYGNPVEKLEPGLIWRGRKGDEIKAVGPNVPGADSLPWIQLIERSIAAGVSLSEPELTRDYSRSNFSNTRAAANADRKRFRRWQNFTVQKFCNPTWNRFAQAAARIGIDGFPSQSDFFANMEDWLDVTWRRPGWATVNPKDDAAADELGLTNNTETLEEIVAERGGDWEDVLEQRAREKQKLEALGLNEVQPTSATSPATAAADPASAEDQQGAAQ
jgi:lambda family phage portal protein